MKKTLGRDEAKKSQIKRLTEAQLLTLVRLWQAKEEGIVSSTAIQSERERLVRLVGYGYAKKKELPDRHWLFTVTPNGKWRLLEPGRLLPINWVIS